MPDLYPMTLDAREPYPLGLENDDRYLLSLDNSDSYGVAPQDLPTDTEVDANAYDILGELLREAFVGGEWLTEVKDIKNVWRAAGRVD